MTPGRCTWALHLGADNPYPGSFYANDHTQVDLPNDKGFRIIGNSSSGATDWQGVFTSRNANTGGTSGAPNGAAISGSNDGFGFGVIGRTEGTIYPNAYYDTMASAAGVYGKAEATCGVNGESASGIGVRGVAKGNGSIGVRAEAGHSGACSLVAKAWSGQVPNIQEWQDWLYDPLSAVNKDGWIGIGTSTPEKTLHLVGSGPRILIESTDNYAPEVNFKRSGDSDSTRWALYKNGDTHDLRFYQGGDKVTIQNGTGNVGIGTAAPARQLHIRGTNAVGRLDRDQDSASFIFVRTASGDYSTVWKTFTFGVKATGVDTGSFFIGDMHTNVSGSSDNRLLIDSTGKVGIGTTAPTERLHVAGNVKATGFITGDVTFANGVRATEEADRLAFLNAKGAKIAVLDSEGNFHIKGKFIEDL